MEDIFLQKTNKKFLFITLLFSLLIEVTGVLHVYIAMLALGLTPSLYTAVLAYLISVLFLIISPFLRGLGAIEMSISYILIHSGLSDVNAIAVTILYRFFEFWLPFFAGILSFIYKANKIFMRILPPFGAFVLGVINIISAVTPPIKMRFKLLHELIPLDIINASNTFVLILGFFLIALSAFLFKGLKTAWWMAIILMGGSLIGNLAKGIDFEEALFALIVGVILIISRKQYNVRTDSRLRLKGIQTALIAIISVFIYGIVGFYFLNEKQFHIDFSLSQSFIYTFQNFFLFRSSELIPKSNFANTFIYSIQTSGAITLGFLFYTLLHSILFKNKTSVEDDERAKNLLQQYGQGSLDYFKTYQDKSLFVPHQINAFIAFRVSGSFAVVLENPVAENAIAIKKCLIAFGQYCKDNGLKDIYYRVPNQYLSIYHGLNKKAMRIGEEAIVDTFAFTLHGTSMKSIRNANNKIKEKGFVCNINQPPLKDGFIQKLKAVSDEWLKDLDREEMVFSQGMFDEKEIKNQVVITVENSEEKIIAFINIIPDYKKNEGTFDLIRKTETAPNGMMDFLMTELFSYFKSQKIQYVDIGFVPFSGINESKKIIKTTMKFAYKNISTFSNFKGQREFKDKFKPQWEERFLIYTNDFDLLNIPSVLKKIIKPI